MNSETDGSDQWESGDPIVVTRPVTLLKIAESLDWKPYILVKRLMTIDIFAAPSNLLGDHDVARLAANLQCSIEIQDSDDDSDEGEIPDNFKTGPTVPPSLIDHEECPQENDIE